MPNGLAWDHIVDSRNYSPLCNRVSFRRKKKDEKEPKPGKEDAKPAAEAKKPAAKEEKKVGVTMSRIDPNAA